MPYEITITDAATPLVRAIHRAALPAERRPLMLAMQQPLFALLREHFRQRNLAQDSKRARKGWQSQNFWRNEAFEKIRKGPATPERASLLIDSKPFAAKVKGLDYTWPEGKAGAIPLRGAVYGKRAKSNPVPGLFPWKNPKKDKAYLASTESPERPGKLTLYYRLVKRVHVDPDPRALPPEQLRQKTVNDAATRYYLKVMQQAQQLPPE